jgi:microcystin degradation protein MlrC
MKIAFGRLYQETCAVLPFISTVEHFSVSEGEEVLESHAGVEDELGGVIDAARDHEAKVELRPILAAEMKSYAGGPLEDQFFEKFASLVVDRLAAT